jgi:hypothetical protein
MTRNNAIKCKYRCKGEGPQIEHIQLYSSLLQCVLPESEAHPASYPVSTEDYFPRGKADQA